MRRRLDAEVVRRGLASSRTEAQRLIVDGAVAVTGVIARKPARMTDGAEAISLVGPPPRYVGRGGLKLEAALAEFALDPTGRSCLDAGSSTGGFTDCLLQHGAVRVVAVDVGTAQLHRRLLTDPRVVSLERTDIRSFDVAAGDGPFDVVTADLSFVSLRPLAGVLLAAVQTAGDLVVLVKPQFEAGRAEVSAGKGVISDPQVRRRCLANTIDSFLGAGGSIMGAMRSPITGAEGNVEYLVHVRPGMAQPLGAEQPRPISELLDRVAPPGDDVLRGSALPGDDALRGSALPGDDALRGSALPGDDRGSD